MKTNLLLTGALLLTSMALYAQNIEEKVSNPGFESSLSDWTNNTGLSRISNGTNDYRNFGRLQRNNSTGTAMTLTTALSGVNPTEGYIKVKFDLRLYRNAATPSFTVQLESGSSYTNYLSISKSSTGIVATSANNAILSYGLQSMPNDTFRTITLLIPRSTAYTGNLRFSYTSGNSGNYADLDNISVTSLNSAAVACPSCYFTHYPGCKWCN
ncbi:MAG: hypothetical protein BGO31_11775 [Bacteroidetes bacterium 43-16]|nr:MAG: hypothetical protein BGO31_11775 [Bacteroidetes bacterium 43-16]